MVSENQLSDFLLDILVCPIDHEPLAYVVKENLLYNPRLKKSYEIKNQIPIMLVDEAVDVDDDLHEYYIKNVARYTGTVENGE